MFTFQQNKGLFKHRRGVFQRRRGIFQQNKANLDHILHELARLSTKSRVETLFYPSERPVFATKPRFTLTQPIYTPVAGRFGASGLRTFGPKPSVGEMRNPCGGDVSSCAFVGDAE
jgi:hypothetical protein